MKPVYLILFISIVILFQACYPEPVADFEYSYTDNVAPAVVSFTNLSTDAEDFQWNFGDGNTSSAPDPVHTYENGGNFTISLKAKGRGGEATTSKSIQILTPKIYSYSIQNLSSVTLYELNSYYWDGEEIWDLVVHGTLYSGYQTAVVTTEFNVISVSLKLEPGLPSNEGWYLLQDDFYLTTQNINYLVINDNTVVDGPYDVKKGSHAEIHPRFSGKANPMKIKDILIKQQLP
jgi:PKD repeat protein